MASEQLGQFLLDVAVRRTLIADSRCWISSASSNRARDRSALATAHRATLTCSTVPCSGVGRQRGLELASAPAKSPASCRVHPALLCSDPAQRWVRGSADRATTRSASSVHSSARSWSAMANMCAASTARKSAPIAWASTQAARKCSDRSRGVAGGIEQPAPFQRQSNPDDRRCTGTGAPSMESSRLPASSNLPCRPIDLASWVVSSACAVPPVRASSAALPEALLEPGGSSKSQSLSSNSGSSGASIRCDGSFMAGSTSESSCDDIGRLGEANSPWRPIIVTYRRREGET